MTALSSLEKHYREVIAPDEDFEQSMLIQWCELSEQKYPALKMIYAIPNGANKSPAAAMKFKRTGLRSGVPDLCLPVARGRFHSLYIEMKRTVKGNVSLNQKLWIEWLRKAGHRVEVCKGAEEAKTVIRDYLK